MAVIKINADTLQKLDRVLIESNFPSKSLRLYVKHG